LVGYLELSKIKEVSLIILSHNGENVIEACLESVIQTDYEFLEIILVDNGSKDKTFEIASRYNNKIEIIKTNRNLSFAEANNLGMKKAKGDFLVLLNDDTVVTRNWIRSLINVFEHYPKVGIAGCKILYPDTDIIQHFGGYIKPNGITNHYGNGERDGENYNNIHHVTYVTGAAFAIRRSLIEAIGYLPEVYKPIYFEEVEYCFRAKKSGWEIVVSPDARIYHYESQKTGAKSFGFYFKYHKNRIKFVLRNFKLSEIFNASISEFFWIFKNLSIKHLSSLSLAYANNFFFAGYHKG
jgi:O-antigen biosynthesis protein